MSYTIIRKVVIWVAAAAFVGLAMYGLHMHLSHNM